MFKLTGDEEELLHISSILKFCGISELLSALPRVSSLLVVEETGDSDVELTSSSWLDKLL